MTPAIRIENLSKQYRLGLVGTGTLSHDMRRWWHVVRGKEDPYLTIGEVNDRSTKGSSEYIWALKDINFEVQQGEVLGIIGKNGAGKSTLLKILSKVTAPTTGSITYKGRIGSLLEVGTGFNLELTGKENIYLNGAILGMRKKEIERKFDEIVNFSGCERYIDTPVKRYSSGMMVRLGFAVAAFLEPEILVVDEVLAVGDAEFQKKAIGKMQDVSQKEGRTVLFVSHNLSAAKSFCNHGLLLGNGEAIYYGSISSVIDYYTSSDYLTKGFIDFTNDYIGDDSCRLLNAKIIDENNNILQTVSLDQSFSIEFEFQVLKNLENSIPNMHLFNNLGVHILFSSERISTKKFDKGFYKSRITIPANLLNEGVYEVILAFTSLSPFEIHFNKRDALIFQVVENINSRGIDYFGNIPGIIRPMLDWHTINKL